MLTTENHRRSNLIIALVAVLIMGVGSFAADKADVEKSFDPKSLVGTWSLVEGMLGKITFSDDGTYSMVLFRLDMDQSTEPVFEAGNWTIEKNKLITIKGAGSDGRPRGTRDEIELIDVNKTTILSQSQIRPDRFVKHRFTRMSDKAVREQDQQMEDALKKWQEWKRQAEATTRPTTDRVEKSQGPIDPARLPGIWYTDFAYLHLISMITFNEDHTYSMMMLTKTPAGKFVQMDENGTWRIEGNALITKIEKTGDGRPAGTEDKVEITTLDQGQLTFTAEKSDTARIRHYWDRVTSDEAVEILKDFQSSEK